MQSDGFYLRVLDECQSSDLQRRLDALDAVRKDGYLDLIEPQFLLDRLNSTSHDQEQLLLLSLMCEIKKPLPLEALMAILADEETSVFLRVQVAHTLCVVKAEAGLALMLRLLQDAREHPWLREALTGYLGIWGNGFPTNSSRRCLPTLNQPSVRQH